MTTIAALEDIVALQAETWASGDVPITVVLNSNHNPGDGGGVFRLDASDTTTSDDGALVIVDGASNRWKRLVDEAFASSWFGVLADGTTNNASAVSSWLTKAAAAGVWADGQGGVIGVSGNITLPDGSRLRNAAFKQLSPNASNRRTLTKTSGQGPLYLKSVKVDKNGSTTDGTIADAAAIWIANINDVTLDNVEVTGNSKGAGIRCDSCSRLRIVRPYIHDMRWSASSDPGTEQLVGLLLNSCSDVDIVDVLIRNIDGVIGAGAPRAFQTDGITIGGSSLFRIAGGSVQNCGEGIDVTGSLGCSRFSIVGVQAIDCDSFGFKFANSISEGIISACIARSCGYAGFVVGGAVGASLPRCEDILFLACKAVSTGSNGNWSASDTAGFMVLQGSYDQHLPANIRFVECEAIDEQVSPTMKYGFLNQIPPSTSNLRSNRMIGCNVVGATLAVTSGYIGNYWASVQRGSDYSVANNTATIIPWDNEVDDPYGLHVSNATAVIVREAGLYDIRCQVEFASSATGYRLLTLVVDGSGTGVRDVGLGSANASTSLSVTTLRYLAKDSSVEVEAFQNSGAALNARSGLCRLEIRKVYGRD
jgi:hypothetical protein